MSKSVAAISPVEFFSMLRGDDVSQGKGLDYFLRVGTIHRAVKRIAYDLASAPLVIEEKRGKKWTPIDEDSDAFGGVAQVFQKANRAEGPTAMWVRFHSGTQLKGESFLLTDYQNVGRAPKGRAPQSLRVLNPWKVTREFGDDGYPNRYRYGSSTNPQMYRPDEILDHRAPHPGAEFAGASPTDAIAIYLAIEDDLAKYQRNFLLNGARGSVVLSTDSLLNQESIDQLASSWTAKKSGSANAGQVWVAANGLKVTELIGRRDTDFIDLFRIIKEQVGMALGVPPAFLGDYSRATLANVDEQTPIYLEGTLYAEGRIFEENLTEVVLPRFEKGGSLRARLAWDRVPMVQRMTSARAVSLSPLVNKVYTREEVRVMLGAPADPEVGEFTEAPSMFDLGGAPPPPPKPEKPAPAKAKWIDDPERHAKRLAAARSIDTLEMFAARQVRDYIADAEKRTLARLPEGEKAVKELGDEWFDEAAEILELEKVLVRVYTRLVTERGQAAMNEAGGGRFTIDDPEVRRFIETNAYVNGKRVVGTAAESLRESIREAASPGATIQDIADAIKSAFDGQRSHALTVARTETVRAYNFASVESWRQSGEVESVEWLTAQDDAVRESHRLMDGKAVALGGTFENGLKFPGDPSGPPEETINCRCSLAPVLVSLDAAEFLRDILGERKTLTSENSGTHPLPSMNGTAR